MIICHLSWRECPNFWGGVFPIYGAWCTALVLVLGLVHYVVVGPQQLVYNNYWCIIPNDLMQLPRSFLLNTILEKSHAQLIREYPSTASQRTKPSATPQHTSPAHQRLC